MLNVVCVKSRPAYDHHYVNRLYRAVERNLTIPHRFTCFTDDATGVKCHTKPLPPSHRRGWYSKLALHQRGLIDPPVFYLDLDTLIVGSLDFIADYAGDFAILRDFFIPEGYGSGVMLWNKPQPHVWDQWLFHGEPEHPMGDQGWMQQQVKEADKLQDLWPGKFVSYKAHCLGGLPPDAAVVSFHGYPKNEDFPEEHWVHQYWTGEVTA